ncbi:hypothetical protein OIU74_023870 [Salix koriyanagi]|uniref:Uncharacterized protein n=1 Tax=Salix koriyanagi TaxID=2511006 RepID=A0A9Q1ABJ1_9ROSI|nr:hypothetical protein OIU74_023870 [Salix koriyanagi]
MLYFCTNEILSEWFISVGKQSRQVRICSKVPPSSSKRSFCGGSGPGYNLSNGKSNLMKKAKMDFLKSREVQNIAAMKKNALPGSSRSSSMMKPPSSFPGKSSASSKPMKSLERRF